VESVEGKGSTFWFTVPLKRNATEYRSIPKPPVLRDVKLLSIDDLPVIRQLVTENMNAIGMRCDSAENTKAALAMMLKAHEEMDPYQMVLIDYLMPDMQGDMLASMINDYPELRNACLVMLTSAGSPLADDEFVKKGFSAYIPKPVETRTLARSLATIWSRYSQGETNNLIRVDGGAAGKLQETDKEATAVGAHVLVAEDNLINQVFIREILEEMGCHCTIVANGKEAVMEAQKNAYDIILMDCLMPVMDGFDATRTLCRLKAEGRVRKSLPIIALTANAMKGDREQCLAAGMDEYISKPVRKRELKNTVASWLKHTEIYEHLEPDSPVFATAEVPITTEMEFEASAMVEADVTVLDLDAVRQARDILKGKYDEMVEMFIAGSEKRLEEVRLALDSADVEAVIRPAHTLKSTAMQMGAVRLSHHAKQMEAIAKRLHQHEYEEGDSLEAIAQLHYEAITILADTVSAFQFRAA
jgi:CheY-like chemotaxis protein/HPt (histidine-containing phosphotransfer) domain-containing protein